ncbi:very-long-chain enoyl-CoA reductase-like [Cyprinus carpio]|uniref:Very-long-chain enoyl-CoA reductase-like n=1 Tax=Cyprinus carpio TaxID=7962 RepID=A0A9Q9XVP9_CYPCA|nr:very-long-chain enoyl-CoA reductase-like [Cyprinus carpio]XP_042608186.1 very-long-chain enoyl-CoA reductase-like [Cyprinus carpio]
MDDGFSDGVHGSPSDMSPLVGVPYSYNHKYTFISSSHHVNCAYYWGFEAWLAYYINHPLYTPPSYGETQVSYALIIFVVQNVGDSHIQTLKTLLRGSFTLYHVPTTHMR